MGIVIKQSFWSSIWAYAGVAIGFLNTLILKPAFFSEAEIGIVSSITSIGLMVAPFATLGMPFTYLRYFAELGDNPKLEKKILGLQFALILLTNFAFIGGVYFAIDFIKSLFLENSPEYNEYIIVSVFVVIAISFYTQLQVFSRSRMKIIVPEFLKDVFLRAGNVILILLYSWNLISFHTAMFLLIASYTIALVVLLIYVISKLDLRIDLSFFNIPSEWKWKLFNFGSYNLLLAGSNSIYANLGYAMIPAILGMEANGIYTTCLYIGLIIEMPRRSFLQIITPFVAKAFKEDNMQEVSKLYKKASINLGIVGFLFMIGIMCNLDDLFSLIPKGESFRSGTFIVAGIAVAKMIDMLFSFNSEVLNYSVWYKWNLYLFIATSLITIGLNYTLLPIFGINGAAIAYISATVFFNVAKHIFILKRFNMNPFTHKHWALFLHTTLIFLLFWFLPLTHFAILNIIVRSILIGLSFISLIYFTKVSDDLVNLIDSLVLKYLKKQQTH